MWRFRCKRQRVSMSVEKMWKCRFAAIIGWKLNSNIKTIDRNIKCCPIHHWRKSTYIGDDLGGRKWVPYGLKERDIEWRKTVCEMLLTRRKRNGFLHQVVPDDEKMIYLSNSNHKNHGWIQASLHMTNQCTVYTEKVLVVYLVK